MTDAIQSPIQSLCELGQRALLATDYLTAEAHLAAAEALAWDAADYDALARLYLPLQEARRQRRQFCGDGAFATIAARSPDESIDAAAIAGRHPRGQLLVAGYASIAPAVTLRAIAAAGGLYLDVPLAAAYSLGESPESSPDRSVVLLLVATPDVAPPPAERAGTIDELLRHAPAHSIIVPLDSIPPDRPRGDPATFGYVMSLWENLHAPFLAAAAAAADPKQKLIGYRQTIRVDYACEFAHQRFSATARALSRSE